MFTQSFQRPKRLECNTEALTPRYGEFYTQPLERGFGRTIGNALRRVLLSSIEGAAITAVRIEGAAHEFTSPAGVLEDTTDIILNLKQIPFKSASPEPQTLTLKAKGPCKVTAAQIETTPHVEVLEPDRYIAALNADGALKMELMVRMGYGYVPAEANFDETFPQGYIPVDSSHSPVRKVAYTVEDARVGQRTDYDKLTLKVWTNGAVTPQQALARAAIILKDHMGLFINVEESEYVSAHPDHPEDGGLGALDKLVRPIEELEISSSRARRALQLLRVRTVGDLLKHTEDELLSIENFGKKSLEEIKERLRDMGLSLGIKVDV
jgi:DNA-directed RNA polymerase subunit alpha